MIRSEGKTYNLVDYSRPEGDYLVLESLNQEKNTSRIIHIIRPSETKDTFKLGRGHESDLRINDISVSRCHAIIRFKVRLFPIKAALLEQQIPFGRQPKQIWNLGIGKEPHPAGSRIQQSSLNRKNGHQLQRQVMHVRVLFPLALSFFLFVFSFRCIVYTHQFLKSVGSTLWRIWLESYGTVVRTGISDLAPMTASSLASWSRMRKPRTTSKWWTSSWLKEMEATPSNIMVNTISIKSSLSFKQALYPSKLLFSTNFYISIIIFKI